MSDATIQVALAERTAASSETASNQAVIEPVATARNVAVDAYRGFVMLLMMGEVLELARVREAYPGNWFWSILAFNQSHVEWAGCSLHDMIQPSFSFLVGVALPYSIASRMRKGGTFGKLFVHAIWRALSAGRRLASFCGRCMAPDLQFHLRRHADADRLGISIFISAGFRSPRWQWGAFGSILFGYWLAWALYPAPGPHFNYPAVGVPADWPHNFTGFAFALE